MSSDTQNSWGDIVKALALIMFMALLASNAKASSGHNACDFGSLGEALLRKASDDERRILDKVDLRKTDPLTWGDRLVDMARLLAESCQVAGHSGLVDEEPWLLLFLDSDWSTRAALVAAVQLARQDEVDIRWVGIGFATELLSTVPIVESKRVVCEASTPTPFIIEYDQSNIWKSRSMYYATCLDGKTIVYLPERGWYEPGEFELEFIGRNENEARRLSMSRAGATVLPDSELRPGSYEEDFARTKYCVLGRLPMELQFAVLGNPARSDAENFGEQVADHLISVLDKRIARLLRESAEAALAKVAADRGVEWTADRFNSVHEEVAIAIAERAPHVLGMDFCGPFETVGGTALAVIADYFSRSIRDDMSGERPVWVEGLKDPSMASSILLTATALRLANVEFSKDLIAAITSMHR